MNGGICVCVLLAVLSASCSGRPHYSPSPDANRPAHVVQEAGPADHPRQTRSVPLAGQNSFSQQELAMEPRTSLNELLSRLIAKKGTIRRNSTMNNRAANNQRIKDYQGWMDFGRRSAEEYEYTS